MKLTATVNANILQSIINGNPSEFKILDLLPIGVLITKNNGNILYANTSLSQLLGYDLDELKENGVLAITHPDDFEHKEEEYQKLRMGQHNQFKYQKRYKSKTGKVVWANVNVSYFYNEESDNHFYLGVVSQISERQVLDNRTEKNIDKTKSIFMHTHLGMVVATADEEIIHANPSILKLLGYSADEVKGKNVDFLLHSDSNSVKPKNFKEHFLANNDQIKVERIFKTKNGEKKFVSITIDKVKNADNEYTHHFAFIEDLTDQKQIEIAYKLTAKKFEGIFNDSPLGIVTTDYKGSILTLNQTGYNLLGYEKGEIIHKSIIDITHEADILKEVELHQKLISGDINSYSLIKRILKKNGEIIWGNCNVTAIRDQAGKVSCLIGMLEDITKVQNVQSALISKAHKLQHKNLELQKYIESNMELENFAYIASHDLREPLRSIKGFSQMLKLTNKDKFDESSLEYLQFIEDGTERMDCLIKDLLTYSRVNTQNLEKTNISPNENLALTLTSLDKQIEESKAEIIIGRMPKQVFANATKFSQLLQNLISNGIKFQKPGIVPKIKINCKDENDFYQFCISDNGIGIKNEYFDKVFLIFKKLHNISEYKGTGIGLAVCKKIVDQHNGEIWVESEYGKGSKFCFTIEKEETSE